MEKVFNIRVYGILINKQQEVLVTDEFRLGIPMTKFPGGGLQFGEGPVDCLIRECSEEMGQEVSIQSHFYTTEHYHPTRLLPSNQQLISIYYKITIEEPYQFKTTSQKFDFSVIKDGAQTFRWEQINKLDPGEFTFPIDQIVARKLKESVNAGY